MTAAVQVALAIAPDGRPAVLLQLDDGYLLLTRPEHVAALAGMLADAGTQLEQILEDAAR